MALAQILSDKVTLGEALLAVTLTHVGYIPAIMAYRRERRDLIDIVRKQHESIQILKEASHFLMDHATPPVLTELEAKLEFWNIVSENQG